MAVPTSTAALLTCRTPGARSPSAGVAEPSLRRSPRERRPGAGGGRAPADASVDDLGGQGPVHAGVLHLEFGREAHPLRRLWLGGQAAVLDPVQRAHQQVGAGDGEPLQQLTGRVGRPDRLGERQVGGAGVQLEDDLEGGGAGDRVTGEERVLDGRRSPPGRQQGEVQVDEAVPRDVDHPLRQQGAVGDDWTAVGADRGEPGEKVLVPGSAWGQRLDPELGGPGGDRAGGQLLAPAGGRVRAGEHRDHLVPGGEQRLQGGQGHLGGPGEDDAHRPSLGPPAPGPHPLRRR